jgi:hypothetical protein
MEKTEKDYSHIKGWGIDADPKNDPTYPMRDRSKEDHKGYNWDRPTQQPVNMEVLHSNERPNVSAVYGTAAPPKGLSGIIRRYAFKFGEGSFAHWLPLIAADRVDEIEGVIEDIAHGHIPNLFAEKGWKAKWEHNRSGLLTQVAIGAAIAVGAVALLSRKKER